MLFGVWEAGNAVGNWRAFGEGEVRAEENRREEEGGRRRFGKRGEEGKGRVEEELHTLHFFVCQVKV